MHSCAPMLLLFCAVLPLTGCARQPPPTIVGHYVRQRVSARDDPSWRGVIGEWQAEYRSDGHLIVHGMDGRTVDSLYLLDGDILTLNDVGGSYSCRIDGIDAGSGRYRVHITDAGLSFDVLRDECDGRSSVLTSHPLRRVR